MARKKAADAAKTKAKLTHAAIQLMAKKGVSNVRMSMIAKQAKVHPTLVNYYFPTDNELFSEVVKVILHSINENMFQSVAESSTPAIESYIKSYFVWAQDNRDLYSLFMYFYHLATNTEAFTTLNTQIRITGRDRIRSLIHESIVQGLFSKPRTIEIEQLAWAIQGLITGNVVLCGTEKDSSFDKGAEITIKTVRRLLGY